MNNTTRNQLSAAAHLGWLVPFPFLGTGLIYFLNKDATVREHGRQAIFFQLAMLIVSMLLFSGSVLMGLILPAKIVGLISLLLSVACLAFLVPPILGAVAAYQGKSYQYPIIGGMAKLLPLP